MTDRSPQAPKAPKAPKPPKPSKVPKPFKPPKASVTPLRPPKPCPICGKASVRAFYPFCSVRCADIDLNRWLTGAYVIPARPEEEDERDGDKPDEPGFDYEKDPF